MESRIEILCRDGLDTVESQRPTEAPIELNAAQAGHERPDGEDARESPGDGDGELLDILIQQFIITVLKNNYFEKILTLR